MKLKTLSRETKTETAAWMIATWFGSGCSPKAPGTVGSLCALPLLIFALFGLKFFFCLIAVLFALGIWATDIVLKTQSKQDPGFVVIDEVVGQLLTFSLIIAAPFSWYHVIIGFALFRFFDIIKLWPASYFDEHVHNAFGVITDDVMAGIYGAILLYIITFFI